MPRNLTAILAGLIAICVLFAFFWLSILPMWRNAQTGTRYVAQTLCSCVFVLERSLSACQGDLIPEFSKTSVSLDLDSKFVASRLAAVISAQSTYHPEFGCRLD